jgi:hypothetical protein
MPTVFSAMPTLRARQLPPMAALLLLSCVAFVATGSAQPVELHRFALGHDMPTSPALVPLDRSPLRALRGAAPPPVGAELQVASQGRTTSRAVAIDATANYLLGLGSRDLARYRANSLMGRIRRVLTKTSLGLAAARTTDDLAAVSGWDLGVAVRATFHDPHDPVLNSDLPERTAAAIAAAGGRSTGPRDEDPHDEGADLVPLYRETRAAMRRRAGVLISGGWAAAGRLEEGVVAGDRLSPLRHLIHVTGQWIVGPRLDLLTTLQYRNAFGDDDHLLVAAGLLRKGRDLDLRVEAHWDTATDRLSPAMSLEARLLERLGVLGALSAHAPASNGPLSRVDGSQELRLTAAVRWFLAHDR